MVEYAFDLKTLFPKEIIKISSENFAKSGSEFYKYSKIIDDMGKLSAVAQNLKQPITTAERLLSSQNQIIYLLGNVGDPKKGGTVDGLLKIGKKGLYLFDEMSQAHYVPDAKCILDFYIHESKQRLGLGKTLFEAMLNEEKWTANQCSIDRPSDKLISFLKKHYGLENPIPQSNKFVLYEGFFDDSESQEPRRQMLPTLQPCENFRKSHATSNLCIPSRGDLSLKQGDNTRKFSSKCDIGTTGASEPMTHSPSPGGYHYRRDASPWQWTKGLERVNDVVPTFGGNNNGDNNEFCSMAELMEQFSARRHHYTMNKA